MCVSNTSSELLPLGAKVYRSYEHSRVGLCMYPKIVPPQDYPFIFGLIKGPVYTDFTLNMWKYSNIYSVGT
jgi:hypothetical protein